MGAAVRFRERRPARGVLAFASVRRDAAGASYDTYQPAYRHGWESYGRYEGRSFDSVENDLRNDWEKTEYSARLGWDKAKEATRDAWHRVERAIPGDADNDGR